MATKRSAKKPHSPKTEASTLHLTGTITADDGTRGTVEGDLIWTPESESGGGGNGGGGDVSAQLTADDFEYLGALRMPQEIAAMFQFSYGGITGRKVDGKTRLFITCDEINYHAPVAEIEDLGGYNLDYTVAGQMRFVQWWWEPYLGKRGTYMTVAGATDKYQDLLAAEMREPDPARAQQIREWAARLAAWIKPRTNPQAYEYYEFPVGQSVIAGLHWDDATSRLFWTYYDTYNVSGRPDWGLGATTLNPDGTMVADGPWRFAVPVGGTPGEGWTAMGPWRGLGLVIRPDTGELLTGSTLISGNAGSPWGNDCYGGGRLPAPGAPWDRDLPLNVCYLEHYPMLGKISGEGRVPDGVPLRSQIRRLDMPIWEPGLDAPLNVNNTIYGYDSWRETDGSGLAYWFDNVNGKSGVVFLGAVCGSPIQDPTNPEAGHEVYATAGNNWRCAHGHPFPVQVTGPCSTANFSAMWIYKISDLLAVSRGELPDYAPVPEEINVNTRWGVAASPASVMGGNKNFGGTYFDRDTRLFYTMAPKSEWVTVPGCASTLIHVFRVGGAA